MLKKIKGVLVGVSVASVGSVAMAQDAAMMTKIEAAMSETSGNLQTVGTSLVIMAALVMGFRWLKATFF